MSAVLIPNSGALPPVTGAFSFASNTTEQTIIEVSNATLETRDVNVRFNVDALTKQNTILRFRAAINGGAYDAHRRITLSASDVEAHFDEPGIAASFRVTIQSTIAEGAPRSIPYELTQVRR